ncbi:hypothetical protein [Sulfuricurvum sp.]|uniref:hypothetical protein n=1 Tax=Sulfuricurvum sp. TaxID=2025608 RepID=UPI00356342C8
MSKFKVGNWVEYMSHMTELDKKLFVIGMHYKIKKIKRHYIWLDGLKPWVYEYQLNKVSPRKEKKKRPALWFTLEKGRIILHGRNDFVMYTRTIYSTSAGNQQLKRLGKESGIEVRK